MPKSSYRTLAKFTRPDLPGALQRGRLFGLLDQARQRSTIWISAPAGAGKTTLVASFIEQREIDGLWMQLDAGDTDAPTFFYYLGLAEQTRRPANRRKKVTTSLPLLTPDFLADLPGFARRYFRELFARLPSESVLVLDNYQMILDGSALHAILVEALDEIPSGYHVIVISREDPPPAFSRLRANETLQVIGWEPLKLTLEESRDIVLGERPISDAELVQLHTRCGGWAAGLRLLVDSTVATDRVQASSAQEGSETLNDYFDSQVLGSLLEQQRDYLLRLAFLPTIQISVAQALTGNANIARLFESMHKRHLFIVKLAAAAPTYRFHDLFRAFLLHAAKRAYPLDQIRELQTTTAGLLLDYGEIAASMALYFEAECWETIAELLPKHAANLIAAGRWNVVVEWIRQMPAKHYQTDLKLLYWMGIALLGVNPVEARKALEASHDLAAAQDNTISVLVAAAAIVQSYTLEYTRFKPYDRWIPVLERALTENIAFPNPESAINVLASLLNALAVRQPENVLIDRCVEQLFQLINDNVAKVHQIRGYRTLLVQGATTGNISVADRVFRPLTTLLENTDLPPYLHASNLAILCYYYLRHRQLHACWDALSKIKDIAEASGLLSIKRRYWLMGFWRETELAGHRDIDRWSLGRNESGAPRHPHDIAIFAGIDGWLAMFHGQPAKAISFIETAVQQLDESGSRLDMINYRHVLATVHYQADQFDAALKVLDEIDSIEPRKHYWQLPQRLAIAALCEHAKGNRDQALALLRNSLQVYQQGECEGAFIFLRPLGAKLCELALQNNIETDVVRELIRHYEWSPTSADFEAWPWPIKLQTLGEFSVLCHDKPLQFGRKAPHKLLQLLRALIAFGGKQVPEQRLIDALWSEQEGDGGYRALAVAIRRLRDLFQSDAAIDHVDGKVSLGSTQVWVDAHAFERRADGATDIESRQKALDLYTGNFLENEADERWTVQYRERLRAKFVRLVKEQGAALETAQAWIDAARCYAKGLEADDLAESFYQGLMRCQAKNGERAEALSTYRRMRQVLSVVLGRPPSAESELLYGSLTAE
jgi:LuxR family transcriptional regulator, maltose regulon positive regulatory protein